MQMNFELLSYTLKQTAACLDSFIQNADTKSGEVACEEYIKANQLDYIKEEIEQAFRQGWRIGYRQGIKERTENQTAE